MKGLIFTYVLTYGGAALSLFNPFLGLLVYICFAIVRPQDMWFWSVPAGNYSRIVAIGLLLGWVMRAFGDWRFGRARPIVIALLCYWLWAGVGAVLAPHQEEALSFVEDISKIVLPFLVGITTIDSARKLKQLAWVIVLSQGYVAFELNQAYYAGWNRVYYEGFGSMDNNSVAISMVTCVGLAFFLGLQTERWWRKGIAFVCALLMMHVVMFAFSRGGMLALVVTGGISFLLIKKTPVHYVALAAVILLGIRLSGKEVTERFMTSFAPEEKRDFSAESRLTLWKDCVDVTLKHPVFGVGPKQWGFAAVEYGWKQGKMAHSLWLQTAAELGIPGFLFLVLFYALAVARSWKLLRRPPAGVDPWLADAGRMVVAAIIGFAVSAQFVSLWGLETPFYVVLIGAGALKLASVGQPAQNRLAAGLPAATAPWPGNSAAVAGQLV